MMVFEEKLRELIELLPLLSDGSKVRYDWGTIDVLNKFLSITDNKSKYPLIWLLTGKSTNSYVKREIERSTKIVIAINSKKPNELNNFQYQKDFKDNLIIILERLVTIFEKSGITQIIDTKFDYEIIPNYSIVTKDKGVLDVWNAIVFEADLLIKTDRCINENIKF